jgi:hypothetical protein
MVAHAWRECYVSARTIKMIATITTITATNRTSTRKAAASERSGFPTPRPYRT